MIITLYHMLNIMGNLLPFLASTGSVFIALLLQLRETCFRHPDWVLVWMYLPCPDTFLLSSRPCYSCLYLSP